MIRDLPVCSPREDAALASSCQFRTVSKDGRIVCSKIALGDNAVSPAVCHACPFSTVNCAHLRFSLQHTSPSPLVVRFNGRTEIWNDDPAQLLFYHAACSERVVSIHSPRACAACPFHVPAQATCDASVSRPAVARPGKVVPFPVREPLVATG
jgi:hypothetical protein